MFHSPEGKTVLEISHISKFSIDNSQFSWHFHFHNRLPHLCQEAELLIPPPTSSYLHLLPAPNSPVTFLAMPPAQTSLQTSLNH